VAPSPSARAMAPATFFLGMARVGCRSRRAPSASPRRALVPGRSPSGGVSVSKPLGMVVAVMPRSASCRRLRSLIVTCRQAGSSGGKPSRPARWGRCQARSWWCRIAGRPRRQEATARAAAGLSGSEQRFSTTTRSASAKASPSAPWSGGGPSPSVIPRPATSRSDPSAATVRVRNPSRSRMRAHLRASTDTPSVAPNRNDRMVTVLTPNPCTRRNDTLRRPPGPGSAACGGRLTGCSRWFRRPGRRCSPPGR